MTKGCHLAALVGAVCLLLACQAAGTTFSDEDEMAIRAASQRYVETLLSGDHDAWIELHTADAVYMPPNETKRQGRDDVYAWITAYPEVTSLVVTPEEIQGRADLAFVRGTYSVSVTVPDEGSLSDRGKYIEIWQRQADGSWRLLRDIWNSDQPAE